LDALGTHLLLELRDCSQELLNDIRYIEESMVRAANQAGATIVGRSFHKFNPRGVTGIVAIAESHLCIHTWPEHGYAAVDVFTCGRTFKPQQAAQLIIECLQCGQPSITMVKRGLLSEPASPASDD